MFDRYKRQLAQFQEQLNYRFKDEALLETALTHPSINLQFPHLPNYERLEFLGDRVLGLCIADMLYRHFGHENEGEIARRHAGLVCGASVHRVARTLQITQYMRFSTSENSDIFMDNASVMENALEALLGAVYLDGGFEVALKFVQFYWHPLLASVREAPKDAKTALQEWAQARGYPLPVYEVVERTGPDHAPRFSIRAYINASLQAQASGTSKKEAEQGAAAALLASVEG